MRYPTPAGKWFHSYCTLGPTAPTGMIPLLKRLQIASASAKFGQAINKKRLPGKKKRGHLRSTTNAATGKRVLVYTGTGLSSSTYTDRRQKHTAYENESEYSACSVLHRCAETPQTVTPPGTWLVSHHSRRKSACKQKCERQDGPDIFVQTGFLVKGEWSSEWTREQQRKLSKTVRPL